MNRLATSSALLLSTLAHVSLTCLSTGLSAETLLAVATGISGSVVTDMIKGLSREKIKHLLFGTYPSNLNRSIKKLFISSIGEALDNILVLYRETGVSKLEQNSAKKSINVLKKHLQNRSKSDDVASFLDDEHIRSFTSSDYSSDDITNYLRDELEGNGLDLKLKDFISQHFPAQIQLCFGEGLKSPEHHDAWVAYQRLMSDELREMIKEIELGQQEIRQDLKDLKLANGLDPVVQEELHRLNDLLSDENKFSLALNNALDQSLTHLEELANRLIIITTETNHTVREIKSLQQEQLRRAKKTHYLIISALLIGLVSIGLVGIMVLRAPFNLSVIVHGWLGKEHIPLKNMGSLTLIVKGKTYQGEIDSQGKVLFADLPYDCSGEIARVRIDNTEGMPYVCCDSTILIKKGEVAFLPISIIGIDRVMGVVKDEESQLPIPNALVRIAGVESRTDSRGHFDLAIPINQQAEEQEIEILKEGYLSYRATHTTVGKDLFRLFLDRQ